MSREHEQARALSAAQIAEPFRLDRADGDHSPVEMAIRLALLER